MELSKLAFVFSFLLFAMVKTAIGEEQNGADGGGENKVQEKKEDTGEITDKEQQIENKSINKEPSASTTPKDNQETNGNDLMSFIDFDGQDMWSKEFIQPKITIRLVKKSWSPLGKDSDTRDEEAHTEFILSQLSVQEAEQLLDDTSPIQYEEMSFPDAQGLLKSDRQYNKDLPSIFVFPPSTARQQIDFVSKTVRALAIRNLHRTYNVFTFDLSKLDFNSFISVSSALFGEFSSFYQMGKAIADFFNIAIQKELLTQKNIHLIGWGYSGQLIGCVARNIYRATRKKIGSIVSLNPVSGTRVRSLVLLNKGDAELVYVYHSNFFPMGTIFKRGTVDVVFNGGFVQPECEGSEEEYICSHDGVAKRFWYIVLYGGNLFEARECDSLLRFNFGLCQENRTIKLTYPPTSSKSVDESKTNSLIFLRTSSAPPYGMSEKGSVYNPDTQEIMEQAIIENRENRISRYNTQVFNMMMFDKDIEYEWK